jgi:DNA-directed RNA polymerase subunit RPC12/RpoP
MKIKIQTLKCLRCGHAWRPRSAEVRKCPKCNSPWWDKPRNAVLKGAIIRLGNGSSEVSLEDPWCEEILFTPSEESIEQQIRRAIDYARSEHESE